MADLKIRWHYGSLPSLPVREITEEQKLENARRLSEWIVSWNKFELEHPELAKTMVCKVGDGIERIHYGG